MAFAVSKGRKVTATLVTGEKIEGWVFGADDYHWSIVTEEHDVFLVHKSSPALRIHRTDNAISAAPEDVQRMVTPFRDSVMRDHFHSRQPDKD